MKFLSVCSAVLFAAVLGSSFVFGFEGRVLIYQGSEEKATPSANEATGVDVTPMETRKRIAAIDPELLWENWSNAGSISSAKSGVLKTPTLIDKNSPRVRGAVMLEYDAIVVWNGLEGAQGRELLIFGSREKSIETMKPGESDVALGIVPLNGKPTAIQRTGAEFESLHTLLDYKFACKHPQDETAVENVDFPERAPYCAFDIEVKDTKTFADDVNSALKLRLPGAETFFSAEDLDVVGAYLQRGVRYFVFDVFDFTEFDESSFTKTSLAIDFPTPRLFIPAEIGKIGKTERIMLDILVFTPGDVIYAPESWFGSKGNSATINIYPNSREDGPMVFSLDELRICAPTVAKFCEENGFTELVGRCVLGSVTADAADGDFELIAPANSKAVEKEAAEKETAEKEAAEKEAAEKEAAEKEAAEKKADEKKAAEKKAAEKSPSTKKESPKTNANASKRTRKK